VSSLTRRDFLQASGGALALTLAAACTPSSPTTPSSSGSGSSQSSTAALPTYVPFQGPTPDFAPSADGIVPAGYLTFPQNVVKSTSGPVGKQGDEVSFLTYSINPTPAPVNENPAWQQVNKDLGLELKFSYTALQDYNVKLNTVIASGQ
jgi:putative aldouronate transport system substrate-binding protein